MKVKRFKFIVSIYVFLIKNNEILLARRKNTGYQDGNYGLVSGHLDAGESATAGIAREANEEAGIKINPDDLQLVHILHRKELDERIDLFFVAKKWIGDPFINEPQLCDDMHWFPLDNLPVNTIPYIKQALNDYLDRLIYAESGWSKT